MAAWITARSMDTEGPGRPAAKQVWAAIAFQSSTASALAVIAPASSAASVIRMILCFIIFGLSVFVWRRAPGLLSPVQGVLRRPITPTILKYFLPGSRAWEKRRGLPPVL